MAKLGISLKNVEVQQGRDFAPIPDGQYSVVVAKAEVKETKAGGHALNVGYQVTDGEFKGRMIFDFINIEHTNPEVIRIGMERLATIAWATGLNKETIDDSDELINKTPFGIVIKNEESNGYKNIRVKAILRTAPVAPTPSMAAKTTAATATKKPWASK